MSFALTEPQLMDGTKTVTRRVGWKNVKPGQLIQAVRKGMGLKKGEKAHKLCVIRVKAVSREPLFLGISSNHEDLKREGFPWMSPIEFVNFFCDANQCRHDTEVTRIEFERVP